MHGKASKRSENTVQFSMFMSYMVEEKNKKCWTSKCINWLVFGGKFLGESINLLTSEKERKIIEYFGDTLYTKIEQT